MKWKRSVRWLVVMLLALPALVAAAGDAHAQGVTTAAISGRVTGPEGEGIPNVQVTATNAATGFTKTVLTNENGNYVVPGLQVGGPYIVEVTGIGFASQTREGLMLTLGQNLSLPFQLAVQAVELEGITVVGDVTRDQVINPNRTGAAQLVTEHQLQTLPTVTRNFTDFIALSPLTGTGSDATAVAQQNNRFNNVQIDGAISQDLFGLGSTGQPGGQAGARSISIEAVREYQVLTAPYDVRQSGFTGGLINAVTKSGTNDFRGSVYGYYRNEDFVRDELQVGGSTRTFGEFSNRLFGLTVGGPIIRDRMHFFVAGEWEDDDRPGGSIVVGEDPDTVTGVRVADAERFTQLLNQLGVSPGGSGAFTVENPNRNLFARIDAQLGASHILTLRNNYVRAEDDVVPNRNPGSSYSYESNFYFFETTTNSLVAQLNSTFGSGLYNELTTGWTRIRDRRSPVERYPVIQVSVPNQAGSGTKRLIAGAEYFSQGNELDQDSWEITNNLSFSAGDHRLTFGAQSHWFSFRNLFAPGITGEWSFNSLDDLAAGNPSSFRRGVPYRQGLDLNARFTVNQLAVYGQTEWNIAPNFVLTGGLRYDLPIVLDEPEYNPEIEEAFGRRTDNVPSGNGIFSPRLGFNWDVNGDRTMQVRGGAGIFTGRYPFVWLSNLFGNTGRFQVTVSCSANNGNMPAFTIDPDNQPESCAAGGIPDPPRAVINLADDDFQWPHAWRFNLAVDRELPWGVVATLEGIYTRSAAQILLRELNVDFDNPVTVTQGGREVYGTHNPGPLASGANNSTLARPNRIDADAADAVVELGNSDRDRSWSTTLQLQKRYADGIDLNASYTYARAEDVSGLTSSIATSNIGFNPVKGSPNEPELATSDYETRHKLVFSGSFDIGRFVTASLFYIGHSGERYSYVYDGDVNADGFEGPYASNRYNDLLYVPTGPDDITLTDPADWSDLNAYIQSEDCLSANRGQIISRNACTSEWRNRVDTRFTFRIPTVNTQRAEITLDIFNVLNLLNEDWGRVEGPEFPGLELLSLRGWDTANNRGIFEPTGRLRLNNGVANPFTVFDVSSRWQAQVGLRYAF